MSGTRGGRDAAGVVAGGEDGRPGPPPRTVAPPGASIAGGSAGSRPRLEPGRSPGRARLAAEAFAGAQPWSWSSAR